MNVSQIQKRALRKVYNNASKILVDATPSQIIQELVKLFHIDGNDVMSFIRSFPTDIKKLVKEDIDRGKNLA